MTKAEVFEEVIAKIAADQELMNKCAAAKKAGTLDAVIKELGYDFTVEEFNAYMEERVVPLSENELEAVSGGDGGLIVPWWWF